MFRLIRKLFDLDSLISTAIVFSILLFLPVLFSIDFLNPIVSTIEQLNISDIYVSKVQKQTKIPQDSSIVLVNIGNLNRKGIAKQIEILNKYSPKVIGIDTFFRNLKESGSDSSLAAVLGSVSSLVMVSELKNYHKSSDSWDSLAVSHPIFTENASTGYANISIDDNNTKTARIFTYKQAIKKAEEKSFAVKIAEIAFPSAINELKSRNNDVEIIDFKRNLDKYTHFDAEEVLADTISASKIRNKIVLLGFLGSNLHADELEDRYFSPMNDKFIGKSFPDIYGLLVHANILSQIRDKSYINSLEPSYSALIIAIFVYFNMLFLKKINEKYEIYYEPIVLFTTFGQLAGLMILILAIFAYFSFNLQMKEAFIAIGLCPTIFETYHSSIKGFISRRKSAKKEL